MKKNPAQKLHSAKWRTVHEEEVKSRGYASVVKKGTSKQGGKTKRAGLGGVFRAQSPALRRSDWGKAPAGNKGA